MSIPPEQDAPKAPNNPPLMNPYALGRISEDDEHGDVVPVVLSIFAAFLASALLWWCIALDKRIDALASKLTAHTTQQTQGFEQEKETWRAH